MLFALTAASAAGPGLRAQSVLMQGRDSVLQGGHSRVEGRVLSAANGQPLPMARVEIIDLRRVTITDETGAFHFERVANGEHPLRVSMVGHKPHSRPLVVGSATPIEVRLVDDAVLLAGLVVSANRFESRLNAVPYAVHAFDKREVLSSAASDAEQFVRSRVGLYEAPCRRATQIRCFRIRGAVVQPAVYIDDQPAPSGLDMLSSIDRSEINRVEIIQGGSMIRVYTDHFMEWAARTRYRPPPIH
jgi:hypothetical protein